MPVEARNPEHYVCPTCQGHLEAAAAAFSCPVCRVSYPVRDDIPDFVSADIFRSPHPALRNISLFDRFAALYETWAGYPVALQLLAGPGRLSHRRLLHRLLGMVHPEARLILDAACGPGTLGRRLARPGREIYGVDLSAGMLRQGRAFVRREGLCGVHFARGDVQTLPFPAGLFDAALCGSALHLFPDPHRALREISRTLKAGGDLVVTTLLDVRVGVLRFRLLRQHLRRDHGIHLFTADELAELLVQTGFVDSETQQYGALVVVHARRRGF